MQEQIKQRIEEEEEPQDCLFWDGATASFDLELYNIAVNTDVETSLKAQSKEEAIKEVKALINSNNLSEGYEWNIKDCSETGLNGLSDSLKAEVLDRLKGNIEACITEGS